MAYNESQQPRFSQAIARLHDVKGNPAPQITPEIGHSITLEQTPNQLDLVVLTGRRPCWAGVTCVAGAGVSAALVLRVAPNVILTIERIQVNKPTGGFVSVQVQDTGIASLTASVAFFRDRRLGLYANNRPSTLPFTKQTGGLAGGNVYKRAQILANVCTDIGSNGLVLVRDQGPAAQIVDFSVSNETLAETFDVMVEFNERPASISELVLPQ